MDSTYILLQHYWWFLVSLLGALLVFLLFVQGGQSLLFTIGKTEIQQKMLLNTSCILRVSSEKRQPTREKDVSSISYDQWYSRSDLTRNRCSDLL